jgi:hypothetical protein
MSKYVCKYSFGKFQKGEPYKGSDRDTAKLIKNGMICPLIDEGGPSEKKQKPEPQVITNLPDTEQSNLSASQAGPALVNETAKKSKAGKNKGTQANEK